MDACMHAWTFASTDEVTSYLAVVGACPQMDYVLLPSTILGREKLKGTLDSTDLTSFDATTYIG